jgi:hypothetical protein
MRAQTEAAGGYQLTRDPLQGCGGTPVQVAMSATNEESEKDLQNDRWAQLAAAETDGEPSAQLHGHGLCGAFRQLRDPSWCSWFAFSVDFLTACSERDNVDALALDAAQMENVWQLHGVSCISQVLCRRCRNDSVNLRRLYISSNSQPLRHEPSSQPACPGRTPEQLPAAAAVLKSRLRSG